MFAERMHSSSVSLRMIPFQQLMSRSDPDDSAIC